MSNYGVDQFNHFILFYFTWTPISKVWSVDGSRKADLKPTSFDAFCLRLLQLHLCIVYLQAGLGKAVGNSWWNGEAIWRSLMLPEYRQFDFSWLASIPIIPKILGWVTLLLELGYPVFIWPQKTRYVWGYSVVGLHLGIALFQGLHFFGAVMALLTFTIFLVRSNEKELGT